VVLAKTTNAMTSLALAFFYLASALCALGCNPAAASRKSSWPWPCRATVRHLSFALLYFVLRGVICNVVLLVGMGFVPFVGWISV
jgi:hypothetical protein